MTQQATELIAAQVGSAINNQRTWGTIIYNVKDPQYGAKGDGVTDDTVAINKARMAAKSTNGVLYFPSSSGSYRVSSPIAVDPNFCIDSGGMARIEAIGASTDGIVFSPGTYTGTKHILPSIVNFTNGVGLKLTGASLTSIYVPNIANCKDGILLETNVTNTVCLDNTIDVVTVNNCQTGSGLKFKATGNSQVHQGNIIRSNFFNLNLYGVYFDSPAASTIFWDDNLIQIEALEGGFLANSKGITSNNGMPNARLTVQCRTFFGGFGSVWIDGGGNQNTFELAFTGANAYSNVSLNGVGNRIINVGGNYSGAITGAGIQASTAPNSRATFNGGTPVFTNRLYVQMNVPALTAGQSADFWVYSPLTTGYSNFLSITPHFSQPLIVQCLEDSSVKAGIDGNASPNQIHMRLVAIGTVSAGQQPATITVGM